MISKNNCNFKEGPKTKNNYKKIMIKFDIKK